MQRWFRRGMEKLQKWSTWRYNLLKILLYVVITLLILVGFVLFFESSFVYHPVKHPGGNWEPPELHDSIHDVTFEAEDGTELHGWWVPKKDTDTTLLWYHGNAGNLSHRLGGIRDFFDLGVQILIMDYRGYGKSEGSPSEDGIYMDGEAAYTFLRKEKNVPASELFILGRSLGAAVATHVAGKFPTGGLILVSGFPSARSMVPRVLPIPGLHFLVRHNLDSASRIGSIETPLLMMHGSEDNIVPPELGRKLFEHATEPKEFRLLDGAGHNNIHLRSGKEYLSAIRTFIKNNGGNTPK